MKTSTDLYSIKRAHRGSGPLPTYFVANCIAAKRGGVRSYADAGWHLAIHIRRDFLPDCDRPDELAEAIERNDEPSIVAWFESHYPRCLSLVPRRRRRSFIEGVRAACEQERL